MKESHTPGSGRKPKLNYIYRRRVAQLAASSQTGQLSRMAVKQLGEEHLTCLHGQLQEMWQVLDISKLCRKLPMMTDTRKLDRVAWCTEHAVDTFCSVILQTRASSSSTELKGNVGSNSVGVKNGTEIPPPPLLQFGVA